MSAIQFSGLASGLDTTAIISAIMGVEKIPLHRLQAQNGDLQDQLSILDQLSSSLSSLNSKAGELKTTEGFLSYTGSIADTSIAKLTLGGDAVRGSYKLEVEKLAQSQRNYSDVIADKTASLTATDTTLGFTIDGTTVNVDVTAGTTLEGLVSSINGSAAGVTAGLMYDGSGYRLQITGKDSGTANAITFNEGTLALNLASNKTQDAQNAEIKLDGFSISSTTNIISDALPGVSLQLQKTTATGESTQITIDPDSSAVKTKISDFVSAYNSVFGIINSQVGEGKGTNTLNGDSTVRTIEQQLSSLISSSIPGLTDRNGEQIGLSQLGIKTNKDGTLTLSDSDLESYLANDFDGAAQYFAGDGVGTPGISGLLDDLVKSLVSGSQSMISSRKSGISARISNNDDSIAAKERYLATYEDHLRAQYTLLESTMSQLQNQGNYLAQFLR